MKIVHFYGHTGGNGVTSYILDVIDGLRRRGHDATIVCRTNSALVVADGTTTYRFAFGLRRSMVKLLRARRPDVVNVHSQDDADLALAAARDVGVPSCYTAHETTTDAAQLAPLADSVIAVSRGVGRYVRDEHPALRAVVHVVPNGIDRARLPSDDRAALRAENRLGDRETVVAFAGRLVDAKNALGLVRAFGRVAPSHDDLRLLIIGDGADRTKMERLARKLGVDRRIDFRGWLPREATLRTLRALDAFVLPSRRAEGLSIAMLECMGMGVPVLATDLLSLREGPVRDGETGWLVKADDDDALADGLARVAMATRQERASLGRAALAEVSTNHTLEGVVTQLEDAYRATIARRGVLHVATAGA